MDTCTVHYVVDTKEEQDHLLQMYPGKILLFNRTFSWTHMESKV